MKTRELPHNDVARNADVRINEKQFEIVECYQNEKVLYRLQTKLRLDKDQAELLFKDTKRFLFLAANFKDRGPLSPSAAIDDGWHEFLMFTEDYQNFCSEHFGEFLHHRPFVPWIAEKPGGIYRTYCVAKEIFGSDMSPNWMLPNTGVDVVEASNCSCGGSCGGGCSSGSCS
jgi:hypothetical protein